jgi:UDP-glucose 4-epimerase
MIGVFGAGGFLGRHIVRRLSAGAVPVRAVCRKRDIAFDREFEPLADLLEGDLRQPLAMSEALEGIETVIQLISSSSPGLGNEHAIADIEENVIPHVEFLQSCVHAGVRRYVFISSGGTVYGPDAPVPTAETWPCTPISSHGITKLTVEKYIQMYGRVDGLEYAILRLSNPFGPGQIFRKGQGLIPAILDLHRRNRPVRIYGTGAARRDFIYVDDVVDAVVAAIELPDAVQATINVGSGQARSVMEVVEAIETQIGKPFEKRFVPARATDVDVSFLDISLAASLLNWRPKTAFEDAIRATVASGTCSDPPENWTVHSWSFPL